MTNYQGSAKLAPCLDDSMQILIKLEKMKCIEYLIFLPICHLNLLPRVRFEIHFLEIFLIALHKDIELIFKPKNSVATEEFLR